MKRIGQKVYAKGIGQPGIITNQDNTAGHPRSGIEALWFVKWDNGTFGGGWADSELILCGPH